MYLDKILGSKTKVNLLSVLIACPERSIVENELAKEAGVSVSEVNRQIKDLVNVGLVAMEKVGKSKVYQANQKHFLYEPLKSVFRSLEEVYREIANKVATFVTEKHRVKTVVLFGSLTLRRVRSDFVKEPSDVDIMIIVEDESQIKAIRNGVLNFVGSNIFPVYGANIYPIVLSVDEYLAGLSKDVFIMNVHSRGRFFMAKSREGSVRWCLRKAEEYLQSAQENVRAGRLFLAAEFGLADWKGQYTISI